MPIPTDGAWPPPHLAPAYDRYREWDAWYAGDADQLRRVYGNHRSASPQQRVRAGQLAGGVVGAVSRFIWGAPPSNGGRDHRIHAPLPADLAATQANLLFSEQPKITHKDTAIRARIEQLLEDGLMTLLLHAAEADSALGDVYLRPVLDEEVHADRAFLAAVHADGAIPVLRWGRLLEVTFWSTLHVQGDTHVRLLEHHEVVRGASGNGVGRIVYALHEGTRDQLGRAIPLTEHQAAAHLADLIDEAGAQETGLDRLDVVRIPNAGPQRLWRKDPGLKYLGRSDFDGNEPWFDAFDETWTNWMRDVRLARGRIIVPEFMLTSQGPGMGATFDADREVYSAINAMPGPTGGGPGITVQQFAIRVEEHKGTADEIANMILRHSGISSQTMGEEGEVAMTATEAQARERLSFTTRGNRNGTWMPALADAIELLLAVEKAKLKGDRPDPDRPEIEPADSVSESPETVARTLQLIEAAQAASIETKVKMLHPDWEEAQVLEEVDRIKADQSSAVDAAGDLGGLAGNKPPGDESEEPGEE